MSPMRAAADAAKLYFKNPMNPLAHTVYGRTVAASSELFERLTRRYGKPTFGLRRTTVNGVPAKVSEEVVWQRPFCRLLHFKRELPEGKPRQPNLVIVAPLSGHYATLLRGTVEAFLPTHEVYITDWADARMVPLAEGRFDLDTYIDYVVEIMHLFKGDCHVMAVCQPAVPVFAAVSLMEARNDPAAPRTMTLMGGPIDTRESPTAVNELAQRNDIDWFRRNVIMKVPFPHPGFMRDVYPGFLQLSGFMTMNLDRHVTAHHEFYNHLVAGDGDSAEKHREFYDEYMSVMDLPAEFYLQTVNTVFIEHELPRGVMMHRAERVDPSAIRRTGLLTVEGEKDDISGLGQTRAAHDLAVNLPRERKSHYEQPGVGHYGVFNGSRFRREIAPRIAAFIARFEAGEADTPPPPPARGAEPAVAPRLDTETAMPALSGATDPVAAPEPGEAGPVETIVPVAAEEVDGPAVVPGETTAPDLGSLEIVSADAPTGTPDDLTQLKGVGPRIEKRLNDAGIFHLSQIAALDEAGLADLDSRLDMRGRAMRENWPEQARRLLAEGVSADG